MRHRRTFTGIVCGGVLVMLLSGIPAAQAHKVMLFAVREGGRVLAQGYFGDGKPAKDALVEVFDRQGRKLFEGRTDDAGELAFPLEETGALTLVMNASMGHRAEFRLEGPAEVPPEKGVSPGANPPPAGADLAGGVTADELRRIIGEELDSRLAPLVRGLFAAQKRGPGVTEIVGGLGYILGLLGVVMYMRSRRS